MTDPDVALVQANSAAFSARDVETMLGFYHPEATVVDRRRVGFGTFTGHAELGAYYRSIVDSALEMHERLDVIASGDGKVAAACALRGVLTSDPTGPEVSAEYGLLATIREGLIVRLDVCEDGDHALELSGLRGTPV